MRFAIVVVGAVAAGALSVRSVQTLVPPNAQMFEAVRALGGNLADVSIAGINPLRAYEDVKQRIASGNLGAPIDLGPSVPVEWPKISDISLNSNFHFDEAAAQKGIAAGIANRIRQDLNHAEDLRNYGRNPMAWHGPPPH